VFVNGALSDDCPGLELLLVLLPSTPLLLKLALLLVSCAATLVVSVFVFVFPPPVESTDVLEPETIVSGIHEVCIPDETGGLETQNVYVEPALLVVVITTGLKLLLGVMVEMGGPERVVVLSIVTG